MRHLTIRVAWHDNQWNGAICRAPSHNYNCMAIARIRDSRQDAREDAQAGRAWGALPERELPPCMEESGGFMNAGEWTRTFQHAYQNSPNARATHGDLRTTRVRVAPYTTFAVPYGWMLAENQRRIEDESPKPLPADEQPPFPSTWVFGRARQEALAQRFFGRLTPEQSLVFFYCKEGQPLGDRISRLVVGVGRIVSVGVQRYYDSDSDQTYPLWHREIHHSIRPEDVDGFLLPYHDYLAPTGDAKEDARRRALLEEIAVAVDPIYQPAFSFTAEHAAPDAALATLARCVQAVRLIRAHGIAKGPWDLREQWLNDQIALVWRDRGAFPGLGSVLQAFGLRVGTTLALELAERNLIAPDEHPWPILDAILRGEVNAPSSYAPYLEPLRQVWSALPDERRTLLQLLARFDLTPEQARHWYDPVQRRQATAPFITDGEILANPYRIAEVDLGDDETPPVAVEVIDRGIFPLDSIRSQFPLPTPTTIADPHDVRRVRAALVDVLRKAATEGDTLLGADETLDRLSRMPLARPCVVGIDWLTAYRTELAEEIALVAPPLDEGAGSVNYTLQLNNLRAHEDRVRKILAARTSASLPSLDADWRTYLLTTIGAAFDPANERHQEALAEQEIALRHVTTHKLSVLTGRAGTGKTAVMGALLRCPAVRDEGVLLLAPTGKARVKLARSAGPHAHAHTIAQFLYSLRRYDGVRQRPLFEGKKHKRERTVVIDECSMLTLEDLAAVLDALDLAHVQRLILVGDPNQLPPIGAGRPFADLVAYLDAQRNAGHGAQGMQGMQGMQGDAPGPGAALARLIVEVRARTTGGVSDARRLAAWFASEPQPVDADRVLGEIGEGTALNDLDICMWQTPDELRQRMLDKMRQYMSLRNGADVVGFNRALGMDEHGEVALDAPDGVEHFQILSPTRMQPHGTADLNRWLQRQFRRSEQRQSRQTAGVFLGRDEIVHRDKVIQTRNQLVELYDHTRQRPAKGYLANGEIGVVASVQRPVLNVVFAGRPMVSVGYSAHLYSETEPPLELAYALTVHKAQGSEFDIVFVVVPEKTALLSRELLYTALTRARTQLVLFIQGKNATQLYEYSMPAASETARRNTNLFTASIRAPAIRRLYAEHLIHRTRSGRLVRSKSELVIANILEDLGLPYEYERVLQGLHAPGWRYPDFTFVTPAGDVIIWEHLGMLALPAYAQGWERKQAWYAANGYSEGRTLFTTADDEQGGLDSTVVEQVARRIAALL